MMRVLVACEFSGVVRRAFRDRGHDAYSCDLLPAEDGETIWHFQDDVRRRLRWTHWDMLIAHPPCTYLAASGARWWADRRKEQEDAISFVFALRDAPIALKAIENPIGILSSRWRKPDQIIQPWQFGHAETKATCLWLDGLPKLEPTNIVAPDFMRKADGSHYTDSKGKRYSRVHFMSGRMKNDERWKARSRTYEGIAAAMAEQWGGLASLKQAEAA